MIVARLLPLLLLAPCALNAASEPSPAAPATAAPVTEQGQVNWHRWSAEIPVIARRENKPVYLFAGSRLNELTRASQRQIFASAETAAYLNEHFVCVSVDMDEQGTLAAVIRVHLSLLRQAEGLPVHLWLDPDLQVIEAAAYLPPTEEWGRPGFLMLATKVNDGWRADPEHFGATIADTLAQAAEAAAESPLPAAEPTAIGAMLDDFAASWRAQADTTNGGFGDAPKHPEPELLRFLLARPGADRDLARTSLLHLANSALRDPFDGGFFRYSTDAAWRLPCLQKTLADQARLALAFLEADALQPDPALREAAHGALDYVLAHLALPGGGFAFSEDGSEAPRDDNYLWTTNELAATLGSEADAFFARHRIEAAGNLTEAQDPGARYKGRNVPTSLLPTSPEDRTQLAKAAELRRAKVAPLRDERALLGPQALLLGALSRAAGQLEQPRFRQAADALFEHLQTFLTPGAVPGVRRLAGSDEPASPTDLAALILGLRAYAPISDTKDAPATVETVARQLLAANLDRNRGVFVVPPCEPRSGFLLHPAPALAEPVPAEALALLSGALSEADAALLRAGALARLDRGEAQNEGAVLLALTLALSPQSTETP